MNDGWRGSALLPVIVFTTVVTAVVSSLGAPLVPLISDERDVTLSTAQWSLTVALLVGAVSAPVMGRLGDGPRRRTTLVTGLAVVSLGGGVSALAPSFEVLLVGRALQGVGLALVPVTVAAAREHLPPERVSGAIALLSVCAAAGAGAGYPITGAVADAGGLPAAFFAGAAVSLVALLCVVLVVPASAAPATARLDGVGAVLLAVGLSALLVAIAEGGSWGWGSGPVVGLLGLALVALTGWVRWQLRVRAPLVELRLLRSPAVLTGDTCALVLAVAMYINLSAVTAFVQTPRSAGYGFSASVVVAGLCLVPFAFFSIVASRALPRLTQAVGTRAVLPVGSLAVATAAAFFALFHDALWQAFVMMAVCGIGLGFTFAAIPGLIVAAVPETETGSARGFYQVVRYIGFSLGSAVTAAVLATRTLPGEQLPAESGYPAALWTAVGFCVAAAALAWFLPARGLARTRRENALGEDDAPVADAGLVGLTRAPDSAVRTLGEREE